MVCWWLGFSPAVPPGHNTSRRVNFSDDIWRARRQRWSTILTVERRMDLFTYLASIFHVSTIPNSSGRLFSPKPTAYLQNLCSLFAVEQKRNPVVARIDLPVPAPPDMRVRVRRSQMRMAAAPSSPALGQPRPAWPDLTCPAGSQI